MIWEWDANAFEQKIWLMAVGKNIKDIYLPKIEEWIIWNSDFFNKMMANMLILHFFWNTTQLQKMYTSIYRLFTFQYDLLSLHYKQSTSQNIYILKINTYFIIHTQEIKIIW